MQPLPPLKTRHTRVTEVRFDVKITILLVGPTFIQKRAGVKFGQHCVTHFKSISGLHQRFRRLQLDRLLGEADLCSTQTRQPSGKSKI
jgi:hypothetical protein